MAASRECTHKLQTHFCRACENIFVHQQNPLHKGQRQPPPVASPPYSGWCHGFASCLFGILLASRSFLALEKNDSVLTKLARQEPCPEAPHPQHTFSKLGPSLWVPSSNGFMHAQQRTSFRCPCPNAVHNLPLKGVVWWTFFVRWKGASFPCDQTKFPPPEARDILNFLVVVRVVRTSFTPTPTAEKSRQGDSIYRTLQSTQHLNMYPSVTPATRQINSPGNVRHKRVTQI